MQYHIVLPILCGSIKWAFLYTHCSYKTQHFLKMEKMHEQLPNSVLVATEQESILTIWFKSTQYIRSCKWRLVAEYKTEDFSLKDFLRLMESFESSPNGRLGVSSLAQTYDSKANKYNSLQSKWILVAHSKLRILLKCILRLVKSFESYS